MNCLAWAGRNVIVGSNDLILIKGIANTVKMANFRTGFHQVACSPDDKWAAASQDGLINILDLNTHKKVKVINISPNPTQYNFLISNLAFSTDSQFLACNGDDKLWI